MRIGIVCYPTFGGSGVLATELGIGLASKGHDVHFITYKRPARLHAFYDNITFHEVNSLDYPLFEYTPYESELASKLVDVVKYENLDVLHVHYAIPHAAVAFMAKQILAGMGIQLPVVTTLHGTDITLVGDNKAFSPVVEFSINKSDSVTAVSAALKEDTHAKFNIINEIQVIYNFIDLERFKKRDKDHFRKAIAPDGEKIIIHTSNFRKVKRVDDVIRVFEKIYPKIKSKLLLIGDGPERPKLEQLCREIGLCSEIRFLGKQDAVEEILAIGDLFILPSANESFGLAALEAMACELPVISTNIGGLPEVNLEGVTGHLLDIGDIDGMAEKAIAILSDETVHNTYKKNAYLRAQEFERSVVVNEYEELYKATIEKVKGRIAIPQA